MCADHFSTMALPVAEFLALEHGTEYSGARAGNDDEGEDMVRVCLPLSAKDLAYRNCLVCGILDSWAVHATVMSTMSGPQLGRVGVKGAAIKTWPFKAKCWV